MTVVRAELARQFYFGDDAVLLVMDTDGVTTFLSALVRAQQQGASRLDGDGTVHDFLIKPDAADIELHDDRVVWRLDHASAAFYRPAAQRFPVGDHLTEQHRPRYRKS